MAGQSGPDQERQGFAWTNKAGMTYPDYARRAPAKPRRAGQDKAGESRLRKTGRGLDDREPLGTTLQA